MMLDHVRSLEISTVEVEVCHVGDGSNSLMFFVGVKFNFDVITSLTLLHLSILPPI